MTVLSSNPEKARAKCLFAEARAANEEAKCASDADRKREAYERKAQYLSTLICGAPDCCVVDFDNGHGDTISIRLDGAEPSSGLHVPICQLAREARAALATEIERIAA